jgi:hypothetical protein
VGTVTLTRSVRDVYSWWPRNGMERTIWNTLGCGSRPPTHPVCFPSLSTTLSILVCIPPLIPRRLPLRIKGKRQVPSRALAPACQRTFSRPLRHETRETAAPVPHAKPQDLASTRPGAFETSEESRSWVYNRVFIGTDQLPLFYPSFCLEDNPAAPVLVGRRDGRLRRPDLA